MPEEYAGPKFSCKLERRVLELSAGELEQASELVSVCKKFFGLGLAPEYEHAGGRGTGGNCSFRCASGFLITGSPKHAASISLDDLVLVRNAGLDGNFVEALGLKPPSSEALMHYAIYAALPQANAVIHWHDDVLLAQAQAKGVAETTELEAGTPAVALAVAGEFGKLELPAVVAVRGHGLVSAGDSLSIAAQTAFRFYT